MIVNLRLVVDIKAKVIKKEDILNLGEVYDVAEVSMGQSSTSIKLKALPNKSFNSVNFKFYYEDDYSQLKEIDIFKGPLFNPYVSLRKHLNPKDLLSFIEEEKIKEIDPDFEYPF